MGKLGASIAAIVLAYGVAALGQVPEPLPTPFFHPVTEFGQYGAGNAPPGGKLNASEETQLVQAISKLEPFAAYPFSGCHDRAHAALLMLPAHLQPKLMKIWVVAPARYTAGFAGTIGLKGEDADSKAVKWGYHVALAWEGPGGLRILDAALKPQQVLARDQWFGLMNIPRMSFWTLTRGSLYQFYFSTLNPTTNTANFVWNGNAFNYEDIPNNESDAWDEQWVPMNLARDAVGVHALKTATVCSEVKERMHDPDKLLAYLRQKAQHPPATCKASADLFVAEWRRWASKLGQ